MTSRQKAVRAKRRTRNIWLVFSAFPVSVGAICIAFTHRLPRQVNAGLWGIYFVIFGLVVSFAAIKWARSSDSEVAYKRKLQGLMLALAGMIVYILSVLLIMVPAASLPFFQIESWCLMLVGIVIQFVGLFVFFGRGVLLYAYAEHGPFVFAKDQPWRAHTTSPYVEFLKSYLEPIERSLETEKCWQKHWKWSEEQIASLTARISNLTSKDRAQRRQGVEFERRVVEAEIKRLQLASDEHQRQVGEAAPMTMVDVIYRSSARAFQKMGFSDHAEYLANRRRIKLLMLTYHAGVTVSDLEGFLRELQDLNFQAVCEDLPPNLAGVPSNRLDEMQGKVETVNKIPAFKERTARRSEDTTSQKILEQQALIDQLERDRDEELSRICLRAKVSRFEELPPDEQDRFVEAENSWEAKLAIERETLRKQKQERRVAQ